MGILGIEASLSCSVLTIRGRNGHLVNCFSVFSDELSLNVPKIPACYTLEFCSLKPMFCAIHILPYQGRLSGVYLSDSHAAVSLKCHKSWNSHAEEW